MYKIIVVTLISFAVLAMTISAVPETKHETKVFVSNSAYSVQKVIESLTPYGYKVKSLTCQVVFPKFSGYGYTDSETAGNLILIMEK